MRIDSSEAISAASRNAASAAFMSAPEAEALVEALAGHTVADVGTAAFLRQHSVLERLNAQAHQNAVTRGDEYVMEAFVTFDKIPVLVQELLVAELWKANVFPRLREAVQASGNTTKAYTALHFEAVVMNLLEAILYHETAAESAGSCLVDLADYCCRKLVWLGSRSPSELYRPPSTASASGNLEEQRDVIELQVATAAVSVLRYLTDHISVVPLSVSTRLMQTHDVVAGLIQLLERDVWTHREPGNICKFVDSRWTAVAPAELHRLTKTEAQVWLALHNALLAPECAQKYAYNSHRKEVVLRLRPRLSEALVDQLPPLINLQRALDELSIMDPPAPPQSLIIEQLSDLYATLEDANWPEIADAQRPFFVDPPTEDDMRLLAAIYNTDGIEELLEDPKCGNCGKPAVKRCSRCKLEWYCGRECQVKAWGGHKKVCDVVSADMAARGGE